MAVIVTFGNTLFIRHTHNHFTAVFPGPPKLLDFMVQGKINRGRRAPTIRLGATACGLTSAHLHHPPYFLEAGYPSCRPTNSVRAPKANIYQIYGKHKLIVYSIVNKNV